MAITFKEKIRKIVQQRNLCSYMNDTKWRELQHAMVHEMPFPPPYEIKYLFENETKENQFYQDVPFLGEWENCEDGFDLDAAFAIEWVKVRPQYLERQGKLIKPKVIKADSQFVEILKKYSIPYEIENGTYCIYGYR